MRPRHEYRPPHTGYYNILYRDDKPFCVNSMVFFFFLSNKAGAKVIYRDRKKIPISVRRRKINQFTKPYNNNNNNTHEQRNAHVDPVSPVTFFKITRSKLLI